MRDIGLLPTDTGELGGKEIGQKVTHVIAENGRFACAVAKLLRDAPANLYSDRSADSVPPLELKRAADKVASKTKYTCPRCRLHAWAKPKVLLICGVCQKQMRV